MYSSLLSVLFSLCILLAGYVSRNKYAMLASVRCIMLMLNLELLLGLFFLNVMVIGESFSFVALAPYQEGV